VNTDHIELANERIDNATAPPRRSLADSLTLRRWGAQGALVIWACYVTLLMGWWAYLNPLLADICKGLL